MRRFVLLMTIYKMMKVNLAALAVMLLPNTGVGGEPEQSFRIRPKSVEVRAGEDVYMRCIVENQKGLVQWSKDGFALGFERRIPGYPRYSYFGDSKKGEHHLLIKGITMEDDGEYQCQVGPTSTTKAFWASANVTVMVSPESISIVGSEDNGIIEVVGGKSLKLRCLVADARPPASVAWYKDGLILDSGFHQDLVTPSPKRRMWSVMSVIALKPDASNDGQEYSCRALHPALEGSPTTLVASVTLSVLHPSKPPRIIGYKNGEVLKEGEIKTLTCQVEGGNPRPRVTWYRHGRPLGLRSLSIVPNSVIPTEAATTLPEYGVVSLGQEIVVTKHEDTAVYECRVYNKILQYPLTTNVTLTVHYPPSKVVIRGPSAVITEKPFTLTCQTSSANPPANITWMLQGIRVKTATQQIIEDEGGGWITRSDLTHTLRALDLAKISMDCEASNSASTSPVTVTKPITIIKRPGSPVVTINNNEPLIAGAIISISCTSVGGNPPPTIRLYVGDDELKSKASHEDTMTRAEATTEVTAADNGKEVICKVLNSATNIPVISKKVISVLFAPWEVNVWSLPKSVEAGTSASLFCQSSSSVPASSISWHSDGVKHTGGKISHSPGLFGGTVTKSELTVKMVTDDNGRVFSCTADNGLAVAVADNVSIDVLHGAMWISPPEEEVEVQEGDDLLLTVIATANPPPVRYSWWRGPAAIVSEEAEGNELGVLRLNRIDRQFSGKYTVVASSSKGDINANFTINVMYGPEEVVAPERVTVDEESSTSVLCSALGNPTPTIVWTRNTNNTLYNFYDSNSSSTDVPLSNGEGEARLIVEWATRSDTGIYLCHASNIISAAPPATTALIVTQPPEPSPRSNSSMSTPWAVVGRIGKIECLVRGAPAPTFTWAIDDSDEVIQNNNKYSVSLPQLTDGVIEWSSVLEIRDVSFEDYGWYTCTAHNSQGSCKVNVTLSPPPPPQTPTNFTVALVKANSATFWWTNDPTGGVPAKGHTIRFQITGLQNYQYVDVANSKETNVTIRGLKPDQEYSFAIQAYNEQGKSPFTSPPVPLTTLKVSSPDFVGEVSISSLDEEEDALARVPRLAVLLISLTGTALFVLNLSIIVCFIRRRSARRRRHLKVSCSKSTTLEVSTPSLRERLDLTLATDPPPPDYQEAICHSNLIDCNETSFGNDSLSGGNPNTPVLPRTSPRTGDRSPLLNGGIRLEPQINIAQEDVIIGAADTMTAIVCSTPKKHLQPDATYENHSNMPDVCPGSSNDSLFNNFESEEDEEFPSYQEDEDDDDPSQILFHKTELCTILEDDVDSPNQFPRGDVQVNSSVRSSPTPYDNVIPTYSNRCSPIHQAPSKSLCCEQLQKLHLEQQQQQYHQQKHEYQQPQQRQCQSQEQYELEQMHQQQRKQQHQYQQPQQHQYQLQKEYQEEQQQPQYQQPQQYYQTQHSINKPTSQVIFHGQPHLQQQSEEEQRRNVSPVPQHNPYDHSHHHHHHHPHSHPHPHPLPHSHPHQHPHHHHHHHHQHHQMHHGENTGHQGVHQHHQMRHNENIGHQGLHQHHQMQQSEDLGHQGFHHHQMQPGENIGHQGMHQHHQIQHDENIGHQGMHQHHQIHNENIGHQGIHQHPQMQSGENTGHQGIHQYHQMPQGENMSHQGFPEPHRSPHVEKASYQGLHQHNRMQHVDNSGNQELYLHTPQYPYQECCQPVGQQQYNNSYSQSASSSFSNYGAS